MFGKWSWCEISYTVWTKGLNVYERSLSSQHSRATKTIYSKYTLELELSKIIVTVLHSDNQISGLLDNFGIKVISFKILQKSFYKMVKCIIAYIIITF